MSLSSQGGGFGAGTTSRFRLMQAGLWGQENMDAAEPATKRARSAVLQPRKCFEKASSLCDMTNCTWKSSSTLAECSFQAESQATALRNPGPGCREASSPREGALALHFRHLVTSAPAQKHSNSEVVLLQQQTPSKLRSPRSLCASSQPWPWSLFQLRTSPASGRMLGSHKDLFP